MDDILIVTTRQSESAILWANHLKTRFDKITKERGRIPFKWKLGVKLDINVIVILMMFLDFGACFTMEIFVAFFDGSVEVADGGLGLEINF
uniref:Uncharacterized protein n=1 Tax=Phlebotomus papatasi TaxID=29031 RepID=A0A1B0EYV6_PHLPP